MVTKVPADARKSATVAPAARSLDTRNASKPAETIPRQRELPNRAFVAGLEEYRPYDHANTCQDPPDRAREMHAIVTVLWNGSQAVVPQDKIIERQHR